MTAASLQCKYGTKAFRRRVNLGTYNTAVEAAVAYAKHMAEQGIYPDEKGRAPKRFAVTTQVQEAEGYRLFLSRKSSTGYTDVVPNGRQFQVQVRDDSLQKQWT